MHVRVLSGSGRYSDPWHNFDDTTAELCAVISARGDIDIEVRRDVEEGMADLSAVDLLVVNVGNPTRHGLESRTFEAAEFGFRQYLDHGGNVWAHHVSATSFPHMASWEEALGGRWVSGEGMHPPIGAAQILVAATSHPIVDGIGDFTIWDERYSHLRRSEEIVELAHHEHEGELHPILWCLDLGKRRAAYDALGHTSESYRHPARQIILRRTLDWLLPT